jgi:hypothetical protein
MVLQGAIIREHLVQAQVTWPHSIAVQNVSSSVAGRQDESGNELMQGQTRCSGICSPARTRAFCFFPGLPK